MALVIDLTAHKFTRLAAGRDSGSIESEREKK
jgi:hypothetical protein